MFNPYVRTPPFQLLLHSRNRRELDVDFVNAEGKSALRMVSESASLECIEVLLQAGASPLLELDQLPLQLVVLQDSLP